MKNFYYLATVFGVLMFLGIPGRSLAAGQKTLTGTVTGISPSGIGFTNSTAATYTAELGSAVLSRKNGAAMQFSDIIVGDKVQVTGVLWPDNSMNAVNFKDLSLYAHNSSFSGKIIGINPIDLSFIIQNKQQGIQTVLTNNFTSFSKNGSLAAFGDLALGMGTTVKAMWDRNPDTLTATRVQGSFRLIDIYFTGNLSIKNGNSITVVGNGNVLYGVDTTNAQLENKNGKAAVLARYNVGDIVKVWGKHLSGSVRVTGSLVKDSSVLN